MMYNTKIKIYCDGTTNTVYCNKFVFGNREIKDTDTKYEHISERYAFDSGYLIPDKQNLVDDYYIHNDSVRYDYDKEQRHLSQERSLTRTDKIKAARDKVHDIVYQNDFKYFVTFTFRDDSVVDRTSPVVVMKKLRNFLSNAVQRKGLKYVLVPEFHKDGEGIHAHLLINDCGLHLVDSGRRIFNGYAYKIDTLKRKHIFVDGLKTVYNISDWSFGFSMAILLDNERLRVSNYVTKYITKGNDKIFGRYYWSSRNLVKSTNVIFTNTDYNSLNLKEYTPVFGCSFKYERQLLSNADFKNEWDKYPDIDYGAIEWEKR